MRHKNENPGFDSILHPLTSDEFIARYWEQEVLYLSRAARAETGLYDGFFPLGEMDRVIAHGELQPDYTLALIKGDVAIQKTAGGGRQDYRGGHDMQKASLESDAIYRDVAQGATFRISSTERMSLPVARLAGDVERLLNANVLTNVFMTPAGTHAFSTHFDAHDVIILQIEGHKHWEVLTPPADLPWEKPVRVRPELFERRLPFDTRASLSAAQGTEPKQYKLEKGDLLYVPRGFSHRAWAGDELSMHLTLEIRPFTWHELFAHAVAQGLGSHRLLRECLPPGFVNDPAATEALLGRREELAAAVEELLQEERLSATIADLADRFVYTRTAQTQDLLADLGAAPEVTLDSRLRVRAGVTARLTERAGRLVLLLSGSALELPERSRSMVELALARRRFTVRELETDLGDASRLTLARHLLKAGLLTLDGEGGEAEEANAEAVAAGHESNGRSILFSQGA
jgi:ribosomal protein L16 Arg81 hydroxylase